MKIKGLSLRDLAIFLSDYLFKKGIETVLSGGACVSIYTNNKYLSYDLDFVLLSYVRRKEIVYVLESIGFQEEGRHFRHKDTPFIVEFLAPPPSVGEEPIEKIAEIKKGGMVLKLLSPTDCVKDRLASFYFWNDKQSLEQAILVSLDNDIDMKGINRWSLKEGMQDRLETFTNALKERRA